MQGLPIWTVYDHPTDHPDGFVARKFIYDKPTAKVITSPTLETLRSYFRQRGLHRLPRQDGDDPKILEVWL